MTTTDTPAARAEHSRDAHPAMILQDAGHSAPVMIWVAGVDCQFAWVNPYWLDFTGRSMAQQLGNGWHDSVHPEDLERCISIHAVSLEAQAAFDQDFRLRSHDGTYRWVLNRGVPRYAPDGRFMGFVGCCLDVDERRALEDQLAFRTEALRLSERRRDGFLNALVAELGASLAAAQEAALAVTPGASANVLLHAAMRLTGTLSAQLSRLVDEANRAARSTRAAWLPEHPSATLDSLLKQALEAVSPPLRHEARLQVKALLPGQALTADPRLGRLIGRLIESAFEGADPSTIVEVHAMLDRGGSALCLQITAALGGLSASFIPAAFALFEGPDAQPQASGVNAFAENDERCVSFFIGPPWVERRGG
jgi:PAS domain S-box-containing protein